LKKGGSGRGGGNGALNEGKTVLGLKKCARRGREVYNSKRKENTCGGGGEWGRKNLKNVQGGLKGIECAIGNFDETSLSKGKNEQFFPRWADSAPYSSKRKWAVKEKGDIFRMELPHKASRKSGREGGNRQGRDPAAQAGFTESLLGKTLAVRGKKRF